MNLGVKLVKISAVYMTGGLLMGLAMGISGDFSLASVHSHTLLLGWATMSIAGLIYILVPGCSGSRLAKLHFWGHNVGLPLMVVSLALKTYGMKAAMKVVAFSSTLVLVSLVIFTVNLYWNGRPDRIT